MSTSAEGVAPRPDVRPANPYVGPRAFRAGEPLHARDRETRELTDLLIAERIVLLHSPSGAGKTSLIQAGLAPRLRRHRFRPTPALRVKTPPPDDLQVHNRYVYSLALDLLGARFTPGELAGMTLAEVLDTAALKSGEGFPVLVIDQFEELLTIEPTDWESQRVFFRELGRVLEDGRVWALFAMREDYIGGLDRYLRYLPGHLGTRYRLDFLTREAATRAIQRPAAEQGITFSDEAAEEVVRRLAVVKTQRPCQGVEEVEAPYVQPFQLQVLCRRLWKQVSREAGDDFRSIGLEHVERLASVPAALARYYAGTVEDVARETGANEKAIRDWFEAELIRGRLRSQTPTGPSSGDVAPADVLRALQDAYLIRGDTRAGSTWYELSHDQLVEPILDDNRKWIRRRVEPWQLAAQEWGADRERGRLLSGPVLHAATRQAQSSTLTPVEKEFLEESTRAERERGLLDRMRRMQGVLGAVGLVALLEFVAIVVLVVLLAR